ncbi:MAG: response regulator of citrate/malate metabolism [Solidesulfovibrio magneticus str. Maddingley MBC34]|uniref:Response regulator of citrate/malate metabolism n=1 Tax=Solidesulfovibrio magneticus str. Maddingley MBC34 TaxID=1206767 RepID=K6GSV1_9BACT|nr:MAG: response regulator of citrate/malate metabolism [Solidesulfovibrio magneticus str. Maddingley MBC34]
MTVPTTSASAIASALIVAASDAVARVDRAFFKQARIFAVRHVASGAEALAAVRRERPSLIFCDATLADMDGRDLVTALRADPELADIPVILAATGGTKAEVLSAVKLGVAGFLLRPYSEDAFRRHLAMASHMARFAAAERAALARAAAKEAAGDVAGAARGYEALAEAPDDAPRHFEEGMAALAVRDVERAILAFHRALAANKLYVEAHLGLARAWLAKGSQRRYRHYMKQAANACARVQRFTELRDQFVTLLAADEAGFNPFLALGNELVRDRHYAAAVSLYRLALELAPKNADAYVGLSKAYHFLRRPDLAERAVRKGLSLNERHPEARAIHRRLTGQADAPEIPLAGDKGKDASVQLPLLLRGVLYLAGLATETLVRPRRSAKAA